MLWLTRLKTRFQGRGERGFTLVELMVALVVLGVLLTAIYRVFSTQDKMFRNQEQIAALQENLRSTVEYVNQELTWMGFQVPGLSVLRAAETDIIFKANIPNTGTTIQYVRYRFDPNTNTISRAAGPNNTDVEPADLTVMANDIAGLSFSYINVLNGVLTATDADPLVADELGGSDDASLLMIQRVKARVTARTSRPDNTYVHPATASTATPWGGGPYRTRSAVLDLKARNAEDVTLQGGQVGLGSCGWLEHTITVPGGNYEACPDKMSQISIGAPDSDLTDNPYVTINAFDKDGNINTNPSRTTYVFATADSDKSPYDFYDSSDLFTQDNVIDSGETLYLAAQELSNVTSGEVVKLRFAYNDGLCTQTTYEGSTTVQVAAGDASHLNTQAPYRTASSLAMELGYEKISDGSPLSLPEPVQIPLCSSVEDVGIRFTAQVVDDCFNAIAGESVSWDDAGNSGTLSETDNGDGTYTMLYEPPDDMGSVAATYSIPITVTWGAESYTHALTLGPGEPYDIIIDSISEITPSPFQFSSSVPNYNQQVTNQDQSSFTIERVDGQEVMVTFHIEDQCGNRIFNQASYLNAVPTAGQTTAVIEGADATYSFNWEYDGGCGAAVSGDEIVITSSTIGNPGTASETIPFSLLETRSGPDAGPWVQLTADPDQLLVAGDTSDSALVTASIMQYLPAQQRCTNIPGRFQMTFEVTGDGPGRSGAFSNVSPFDETTKTAWTDTVTGQLTLRLYSGTAQWNDTLDLRADAIVQGATYTGNLGFAMKPSEPGDSSGIYRDALYTTRVGTAEPVRGYAPGDTVYVQIFDFDENEDPTAVDSQFGPEYVEVTLSSLRTGDAETIRLTETNPNTALFQQNIVSVFSTTASAGDGLLQVTFGDVITAYYEDRNDSAENRTWQAYTSGPAYMEVYKYHSAVATSLITGVGLSQTPQLAYGDKVQPVLYLPIRDGDGSVETDTLVLDLLSGSGDDADLLVMREQSDTGVFVPDWYVYTGAFFTLTQNDPTDAANLLATPTSPRFVTLTYDEPGVTVEQATVFVKDSDPPIVSLTAPADGAIVGSQVTVTVAVEDIDNFTADAGISRIDLMINGIVIQTMSGADLSPSQNMTWMTKVFIAPEWQPLWLDGSHTLSARAWDNALNTAVSAGVDVTLDNNLRAIEFLYPGFSDVFSATVTVGVQVAPLDPAFSLSDVYLAVEGDNRPLTPIGGDVYEYDLDTAAETEGPIILVAYVKDQFGNISDSASLDIVVDRTPPAFNLGTPVDWVTRAHFPVNNPVLITEVAPNMVDSSSVTTTFSGACGSPVDMPYDTVAGDVYTFFWDGDTGASCISGTGVEGTITWTVKAADMASPANTVSRSVTTNIDTVYPVMDSTISVAPLQSGAFTINLGFGTVPVAGFVRGPVLMSANVADTWPSVGAFSWRYIQDPGVVWSDPSWGSALSSMPIDASGGSFSMMWTTDDMMMSWPNGVYTLLAEAWDRAGNESQAPAANRVYVDNVPPWVSAPEPMPNWPARSKVDFRYEADAEFGFMKAVSIRIYRQADVFGAGWPDNHLDEIIEVFPLADRERHVFGLAQWDTTAYPDGQYEAWGFASDWAGNVADSGWGMSFQINNKYITGESYNFASYCATPACVPAEWELTEVTGTLMSGGSPATGESILVEISSGAFWDQISTATDAVTGKFAVNVPPVPPSSAGHYNFLEGDWVSIWVYHVKDGFWTTLLYMDGQVPGTFPYPPLTVFKPSRITTSGNYLDVTGTSPGPYTATVGGELYSPTGPATGVTVEVFVNVWDPFLGMNYNHWEQTTSSAIDGTWSISIDPFDVPLNDGYDLNVDVYYWKDGMNYFLGNWWGSPIPDGPFWAWFN